MQHSALLSPHQHLTLRLLFGALTLRGLLLLAGFCWLPLEDLVELVHDDAYYYLAIARHAASGEGFTFGGITLTNGFQWLWQILMTVAAWTVHQDRLLLLAIAALSGYLCFAVLFAWTQTSPPDTRRWRASVATGLLIAAFALRDVFWQGMETTLFVLLFPGVMAWIERKPLTLTQTTLLFVMLPLARLDALALLVAGYLLLWRDGELFPIRRQIWAPACVAVVTLATYAGFNMLIYGVPVPISGLNKAADAPHFANFGIVLDYLNPATGLALFAWLIAEWVARRSDTPRDFLRSIAVMALATIIQYFYYACFSGWPLWPWYLYLEAGLIAAICARVFTLLPWLLLDKRHRQILFWLCLTAICMIGVARSNSNRPLLIDALNTLCKNSTVCLPTPSSQRSFISSNLALAQHPALAHHVIAMGDRAGSLGFWMPDTSKLLQLEGLVEDKHYFDARLSGRGESWLVSHGTTRLVVDREIYPVLQTPDGPVTVIIEPVQGRVSLTGSYPICFGPEALLLTARSPWPSEPRVYDFHARRKCTSEAWQLTQRLLTSEQGLRHFSLPSEYPAAGLKARLEAFDRQRLTHTTHDGARP